MKIGVISDIHTDINKDYDVYGAIVSCSKRQGLDMLIIPGDINENSDTALSFVEKLNKEAGLRTYFVPGNHDMWDLRGELAGKDTNLVHAKYKASEWCLSGHDLEIGDYVFVGDVGWYDYSFASAKYTTCELSTKTIDGRTWMDSYNAHWGMSDIEVNQMMLDALEERIVRAKAAGKKVIMVTHHLTHPYFKVLRHGQWEFLNAFLGSSEYAIMCEKYGVEMSLMGHVHHRQELFDRGTNYVCPNLGYHTEWKTKDVEHEVEDSMYIFEI